MPRRHSPTKLLALTLLVPAALALGACGGDEPDGDASRAPAALDDAGAGDRDVPGDDTDVVPPTPGTRAADGGVTPPPVEIPPRDGVGPAGGGADGGTGARRAAPPRPPRPDPGPPPVRLPDADSRPVFHRPEHVRGIYLNRWAAGSPRRVEALLELARRTEVNAFVIDIKDATGRLSHASGVPLARQIGATAEPSVSDMPGLLRRLADEGVWPIARIVIVKDPFLTKYRPDLAVQDTAGGPWIDSNGFSWMNPWSQELRDYHLALAREAVAMGFPEIQWDYVRFADAPSADLRRAVYPGADDRPKAEAIRDFLGQAEAMLDSLGARNTADVFGVTTSARDVGIGQIWERFIDRLDVALPMVYPSHYWRGSFGIERPNAHPYEIITEALRRGQDRSERVEGAGTIRPWLQDFSLGEPDYGGPEVRAQIEAARDLGILEWVLWNPGSRYTEEALEPVGGWDREPLIRVAGQVVPVSERHEALRRAARAEAAAEAEAEARREAEARERDEARDRADAPRDSVRPRVLDRDSLRSWLDTLQARDTLGSGGPRG